MSISIRQVGTKTFSNNAGTVTSWVSANATYEAINPTQVRVKESGVTVVTLDIADITTIDGTPKANNSVGVADQLRDMSNNNSSAPNCDLYTTAEIAALTPAKGLIVYDTDEDVYKAGNGSEFAELGSGSSSPYLVYTALLTQSSTDPIAATVLQNTMGTVTASAFSTDEYILLETTIDYDPAKVFIAGFATAEGSGAVYVPIISGGVLAGYYSVNAYAEAGKLAFQVAFYTDAFAAASMSSLLTTNRFSMPEVRVYE